MTANEHEVKADISQTDSPPVEAETKPKRRSRAKAAPAATGEDTSQIQAPPAETEIKPKRRRRAKAAAENVEAPEAEVPTAEVAVKPKRRSRAKGPVGATNGNGRGALVIVESPTKAKTIGKYLGSGYTVKATVGHVRDLPKRELGVDVEHGFVPKYVTIKGKTKTLAEIKKAAKAADRVLIATDPDREGEAIAWHVAEQVGNGPNVRRVLFHEITKDAVALALANPVDIDQKKVDAQQARRVLDRLVGYKASPILWKSLKTGLSAGRVQTVALRLIVEREDAIRKFVPQEYWTIEADLEKDGQMFQARLHKLEGHKPEIKDAATAQAIVDEASKIPFVVSEVARKERRKRPSAPFTTSTLQQEAAKQLGFSAKRTMRAAQGLYEGQEVGADGQVGLITYMRTDSVRVADSAITQARAYIGAQFDKRYLPDTPNVYGSTKGAQSRVQDAHEAVRPTEVMRRPEDVQQYLEADLFKLYQLIWRRFVASQMTPTVYETTTVDFDLGRCLFRATGSRVLFDGYHVLYQEAHEPEEGKSLEDLKPIPELAAGDQVTVQKITPSQHFTEPPPRFSEASLVKELERLGIGRPSTYATIISTLQARWYVTSKDRRFTTTDLGETVCKIMVSVFPDTFNVGFTALMETELDKVEEGDVGWQQVLTEFWGPFSTALAAVDMPQLIRDTHDLSKLDEERCPLCASHVILKSGRFGPYIACVNYPDPCTFTRSLKKDRVPDRPSDEICTECGSPMVIKTGRFGEFLACTTYPKCKHTRPVPLGIKCPKCIVGDLAERRTKKGRNFFGCLRYPECDFSVWNRPVPEICPNCGYLGMEHKKTKATGAYRKCLKCLHEEPILEGAAAESVAT